MSAGDVPRSPSDSESLNHEDDTEEHTEEPEVRKPENKSKTFGAKRQNDVPVLLNRRSKIVNGYVKGSKDKKQVRGKEERDNEERIEEIMRKEKDRRSTDSGIGRMSAEGVESPTTDDQVKRTGWERGSGRWKDGDEGQRGSGERGRSRESRMSGRGVLKKEEMARLEKELEQEMRYRATLEQLCVVKHNLSSKDPDTIQWSVGMLEQSVQELEKQLQNFGEGTGEGSEYKLRYEAQLELNDKLEEQTTWYLAEVDKTREKIKRGQEYTYDQDLDEYNEFELLRMVKTLERERNNLYSDLRNLSWILDNHSKEYYHLKELIRAYTGDLTIVNRSLEHMWRQQNVNYEAHFTGGSTPVTSPGGVKWSGQSGIRPSQRILDPRKGPIRKTVGVRSLPRLDLESLAYYDTTGTLFRKARSRSRGRPRLRAKSLDTKKEAAVPDEVAPLSPVLRAKSEESSSVRSSSGVFEESCEASNDASTTASVELSSDKM
ncbi:cilia- and flagella-associated protein 251-like isoform X2 [Cherax quadricarinatus]|uniref:cilia- and flagella-associated protein 251-like isoform X2 n=1 Tax=Cherax quadricarinatus TaxID=27406 RepID=UPI00387EDE0A